jgi:hypothetical protein
LFLSMEIKRDARLSNPEHPVWTPDKEDMWMRFQITLSTDSACRKLLSCTVEQEEISCHGNDVSHESSRESFVLYTGYWTKIGPHQTQFGYTPDHVCLQCGRTAPVKDPTVRVAIDSEANRRRIF